MKYTTNFLTYVTDYYHKATSKFDGKDVTRYIYCVRRGDRYKLSSGEASAEEISRDEDYEYSPGKAYVLYDRPDEKDYYYCSDPAHGQFPYSNSGNNKRN